jgi:hypothetical protein
MANVENLKKVRETIVEFRENFYYKHIFSHAWRDGTTNKMRYNAVDAVAFQRAGEILQHQETEECGTLACIAGFCYAIQPKLGYKDDAVTEAVSWLDLTVEEANWLLQPEGGTSRCFYSWDAAIGKLVTVEHSSYLLKYPYDATFPGFIMCDKEQGYNEALRRLDFLIKHYSKEEQNGKLEESQESS